MFKESAKWNAFILYLPVFLGVFLVLLVSNPRFLILSIYSVGLILFFVSKLHQFYKKKWVSFGTSGMKKIYRNLYWAGYSIMGFSVFIAIVVIAVQKYRF
jgi:membrane-associated HD superfamily phosphohydrolase